MIYFKPLWISKDLIFHKSVSIGHIGQSVASVSLMFSWTTVSKMSFLNDNSFKAQTSNCDKWNVGSWENNYFKWFTVRGSKWVSVKTHSHTTTEYWVLCGVGPIWHWCEPLPLRLLTCGWTEAVTPCVRGDSCSFPAWTLQKKTALWKHHSKKLAFLTHSNVAKCVNVWLNHSQYCLHDQRACKGGIYYNKEDSE